MGIIVKPSGTYGTNGYISININSVPTQGGGKTMKTYQRWVPAIFLIVLLGFSFTNPQTIRFSDLSSSTMHIITVQGDRDLWSGTIIHYVITLKNTGTATAYDVAVGNDIPVGTHGFQVLQIPDGACDYSEPAPAGLHGSGVLSIDCIDLS